MMGSLVREQVGSDRVQAARSADRRAAVFEHLVDRQLDDAYRLAAIILNDRMEAEDAVHDAAVAAWRGFERLRDPGRFDPWFRRILVNVCRDRLRARARRRIVDLGRELREAEQPRMADPAEATATRDVLARAFDALDPNQRILVTLRYHTDLTVPSIAAVMDMPEGTIKSRLHQAIGRLRTALEEADR